MAEQKQLSSLGADVGFLGVLQRVGNKLPDPFILFTYFSIIVLVLSFICAHLNMSVEYTMVQKDGTLKDVVVVAQNLISVSFFQSVLKDFTKIYVTFLPFGMVLVFVMGIGYMQALGFFDAFMKRCLGGLSPVWVTFMVALIGINGNIASSGGVVMATTLGAAIFSSIGRNPMLGGIVGYVSSHGGFTANFMISGEDVICATVTKGICEAMGINAVANPLMNYYFIFAMTLVMAGIVTLVTELFMPKVMNTKGRGGTDIEAKKSLIVTDSEKKGLHGSAISTLIYVVLILLATVPASGILRNPDTGTILPSSPLLDGMITLIFFLFIFAGTGYGLGAKTLTSTKQIAKLLSVGVRDSLSYIVTCLPAAFFIYFFGQSKLATIIAINGADFLKSVNFTGLPLVISFVLLCAFLNMFMTSNSAKWMILAPIFVPMFAAVGLSPALTQVAYRIGDTCTNPITPINYFIPLAIAVLDQYRSKDDPEIGFGHVISMTMPYSIAFLVTLIIALTCWILLGLPLGPGAGLYMK